MKSWNIIKKNCLIMTSLSLLYFKYNNVYYIRYINGIK